MATNAESGKSSLKIFLGSLFVVILLIAVFLSQDRKTADLASEQPAASSVTSPMTKMQGRETLKGEEQISQPAEQSSQDVEQTSPRKQTSSRKQTESARAKRNRPNISNGRRSETSAGELIPVLTGGAGAHHSLGGGASLGGH